MPFEPKHPVPVFPLPGVVLFPGARLPLHVFELRYRTMVRDALSGERVIALALLLPGWERDYHGSPEFHPLACLARIDGVSWLPDDCYNLDLVGLVRVRLGRAVREFPYRAVRAQTLPQEPFSEDDALVQLERRALVEAGVRLARSAEAPPEAAPVPGDGVGFEPLVNSLCMGLAADPAEKLALLGMDSVIERARRARELIELEVKRVGRAGSGGGERN
ncbi:MAG TPA: LON peptidase substrate-binding domain-containing protein [Candidatus Eisenbacteria bacterium]|nr:LON peptidase substrate-binding domain-containing protein [Candidatus Eisenbacteria bacterium]